VQEAPSVDSAAVTPECRRELEKSVGRRWCGQFGSLQMKYICRLWKKVD
jgi:hypothetical protein